MVPAGSSFGDAFVKEQNWPPRPVWQPPQAEQLINLLDIHQLIVKTTCDIFVEFCI